MTNIFKKSGKYVTDGFYIMTAVAPMIIVMLICSPFRLSTCLLVSLLGCFLYSCFDFEFSYSAFIIVYSTSSFFGKESAYCGMILYGILILAFSFTKKIDFNLNIYVPAHAGIMLGFAFYMTAMLTTLYFGIGATGNNIVNIIKSYVSLGFHANWRGVLYGTIVMVIMITYPRKFKNLSKKIKAPFWALLFTTLLNLFLNPIKESTAISEYGEYSLIPKPLTDIVNPSFKWAMGTIICAFSLLFLSIYKLNINDNANKKSSIISGLSAILCGIFGIMPLTSSKKAEKNTTQKITSAIIGFAISIVVFVLMKGFIQRIPVHSAAVVLIVGLWQQVDWHKLKLAFTSGIKGVIITLIMFATVFFTIPEAAIIIATAITIIEQQSIKQIK